MTIKNSNEKDGILDIGYKCDSDEATFTMRICTINNSKLSSCRNAPKDKSLYSYVDKGTLIWVEAGNLEPVIEKDKKSRRSKRSKRKLLTLIVPEYTTGEFQDTVYCKNEPRKFDIMEKLSAKLISVDPELKKDGKEPAVEEEKKEPKIKVSEDKENKADKKETKDNNKKSFQKDKSKNAKKK